MIRAPVLILIGDKVISQTGLTAHPSYWYKIKGENVSSKKEDKIFKKIKKKLNSDTYANQTEFRNKLENNLDATVGKVEQSLRDAGEPTVNDYVKAGIPLDLPPNPFFETIQDKLDAGEPIVFSENGLFHTAIPIQTIKYKVADNENVTQNEGSFIVLGTDRPKGTESGYGAKGSNRANSIDLVVGRMSSARGGKGPKGSDKEEGAFVDNSFFADAARVHISQLTDIDKNFGLALTNSEASAKQRSGIGIKADGIRIIGRGGN